MGCAKVEMHRLTAGKQVGWTVSGREWVEDTMGFQWGLMLSRMYLRPQFGSSHEYRVVPDLYPAAQRWAL